MATYVYGDYQPVSGYGFKFRSFLTYETNLTDTTCQLVLTAGMQCGNNTGGVGWDNCTISLSRSDDNAATITKTIDYRTKNSDSSQRMTAISAQTWTWERQNTDTTVNITATLAKGSRWAASTATYQLIVPALPLCTITANTQKTGINITGGGWTVGSTTGTKQVKKGETIGTLPTMGSVPIGYTLLGWYTASSGGTKISTSTIYNTDSNIYAQWQANDYTVTLNNQSATTAGTTTIYTRYNTGVYLDSAHSSGKIMTTSSNNITVPTRTGYTFGGYYSSTNGAGTQLISPSGYITSNFTNIYIRSNTTLYAKWTVNDYTVSLNNQSATSAGTSTIYTRYNTGVYLNSARSTIMTTSTNPITMPTRTGYTFKGYYSGQNGAGVQLISTTGYITNSFTNTYITVNNTSLYAKWTANTYDITYNLDGGTHGTNHPTSATYDITFTVNNPTKIGYTFTGWNITGINSAISGTKETSFKNLRSTSGTVTFTATWAANTYTVTFKSGNTTLGTQSFEYNQSQRLTSISNLSNIPVSSNKGWGFVGWSPNVNTIVKTYSNNELVSNLTTTAGENVILYGIWSRTVSFKYYSSATATTPTESNSRIQYYRNTTTTGAATSAVSTYAIQNTYDWEPQGWVLNDNSSTSLASSATTTVASVNPAYNVSANYYALYKRSVAINYDKNNANASGSTASTISNQFYNCGNNVAIDLNLNLANNSFTWANHTFNGWQYNSSNVTSPYTFPNTGWTSSKNITLNATWIGNNIAPQFTIEAIRADNNGINSDTGESCKVKINAVPGKKYSNSDNTTTNNNTTISVYYKTGTNSYTQSYLFNNGSTVKNASFSNNITIEYILVNSAGNKITFEQANTYDIKVVLADNNTSVTQTTFLSAAYFALDFNATATALGIFKAAPDDGVGLYIDKQTSIENGGLTIIHNGNTISIDSTANSCNISNSINIPFVFNRRIEAPSGTFDNINYHYANSIITGGTQTAAVTTSPYKPALWKFNAGITPTNGDVVFIQSPGAGHSYGEFLSLDNGTTYKPIAHSGNNKMTTHYGTGSPIMLVYDSDWSVNSMYPLAGGTETGTITGGAWRVVNGYLDGNTYTQAYCGTAAATAAKTASMSSYVATANRYVMVNIYYANTAASAITLNINGTGAKPIYINGSASGASNYTLPAGSYLVYYNGTNYYFRTDGYITVRHMLENPSEEVTRYLLFSDGTNTVGINNRAYTYLRSYIKHGTASVNGYVYLALGSGAAQGNDNNSFGCLRLYSVDTGYSNLRYISATNNVDNWLPSTSGTLLNTGTTSFTQTLSSGTSIGTIKINGTSTTIYAPTNTDTKVSITATNPASGTWYYPVWHTAASGTSVTLNANTGFLYYTSEGTTSAIGHGLICAGNNKGSGTAGNKRGRIRIFSSGTGYGDLYYSDTTASNNTSHYLPSTGGTILNTDWAYLTLGTSEALYTAINNLGWTSEVIS